MDRVSSVSRQISTPDPRPYSRTSEKDWKPHRDKICELYKKHPLKTVMKVMRERHRFNQSKRRYVYRLKLWRVYKYVGAQRPYGIRLDEAPAGQDLSSTSAASTSSRESRFPSASPCQVNDTNVPGSNPIAQEDRHKWRDSPSPHDPALEEWTPVSTSNLMPNLTRNAVNTFPPSRKEAGDRMVYIVKTVRSKAERDQALLLLDRLRIAFSPSPCPLSERMVVELRSYLIRLQFRASHNWGQTPHPSMPLGTD